MPSIPQIPVLAACLLITSQPVHAQRGDDGPILIHKWNGGSWLDSVGYSVDGAGDVDGDGVEDIISGTPFHKINGNQSAGAASVYSGASGDLLYRWAGPWEYNFWAGQVAGVGDIDADGVPDVAFGDLYAEAWSGDRGSVRVHSGADGSLLYTLHGPIAESKFGYSIDGSGDVDGDGHADIVIGAPGYDDVDIHSSDAYVISGRTGDLIHSWTAPNWVDLGHTVSAAGDFNQDGYDDVLVGAPGKNVIYVFSGFDGSQLSRLRGINGDSVHATEVALIGDANGDGFDDFAATGRAITNDYPAGVKAVLLFSGISGFPFAAIPRPDGNNKATTAIASAGDIDSDGLDDVMVSVDLANPGGVNQAGSVFVYSSGDGRLLLQLHGEEENDYFGSSIASISDPTTEAGTRLVIGCYGDFGYRYGSVSVYGFAPYLKLSTDVISIVHGGTIDMEINLPTSRAGMNYMVLASHSGTGPITRNIEIPLSADTTLWNSSQGQYAVSTHQGMHGTLDAAGNASASLTAPAGINPWLLGRTYWFAAIVLDANGIPQASSAAKSIQLKLF